MLNCEVMSLEQADSLYGDVWERIIASNNVNPTMLPGWLKCVSLAFNVPFSVFVYRNEDKVVGFVPFYEKETSVLGLKLNTICLAGNLLSYHQELAVEEQYSEQVLTDFVDSHFNNKTHLFIAGELVTSGLTYRNLANYTDKHNLNSEPFVGDSSPYIPLKMPWIEMLQAKNRKFRYKVNGREKELRENAMYQVKWYSDNVEELLDAIFKIEEKSWKVDESMDITSNTVERNYYQLLLPFLATNKMLSANVLFIDGVPAAYNLCYKWSNIIGQIKTSYDTSFQSKSPGAMIIEDALRVHIEEGISEFDFLGNIMSHKMAWTKEVRCHESVFVYNDGIKPQFIYSVKQFKKKLMQFIKGAQSISNES